MGYTVAQVEEIAGKLRALPEVEPPPKDLTKQEVVKMLANEIKLLQKKGYTLEQIASSLKGEGLDISTPTLKSYLQRTKTTKPKSSTPRKPRVESTSTLTPSVGSVVVPSTESTPAEDVSTTVPKVGTPAESKKTQSKSGSAPRPDSVDL